MVSELKALNLPRAGLSLCSVKAKDADHEEAATRMNRAIESYLSKFADPTGDCLKCGLALSGFMGTFTWGLCHGEGQCSHCGYPARAYHHVIDEHGEDVCRLNHILQYHPDELAVAS